MVFFFDNFGLHEEQGDDSDSDAEAVEEGEFFLADEEGGDDEVVVDSYPGGVWEKLESSVRGEEIQLTTTISNKRSSLFTTGSHCAVNVVEKRKFTAEESQKAQAVLLLRNLVLADDGRGLHELAKQASRTMWSQGIDLGHRKIVNMSRSWYESRGQYFDRDMRATMVVRDSLLSDQAFQLAAREYIIANKNEKGKRNLKAPAFAAWCTEKSREYTVREETVTVSASTARRWMNLLGFKYVKRRRGFVDTYDAPEQKAARKKFNEQRLVIEKLAYHNVCTDEKTDNWEVKEPQFTWDELTGDERELGKAMGLTGKPIFIFYQDEATYHTNDDEVGEYIDAEKETVGIMRKKYQGTGIMSSKWVNPVLGFAHTPIGELKKRWSGFKKDRKIIDETQSIPAGCYLEFGKQREGWNNGEKFQDEASEAIAIMELFIEKELKLERGAYQIVAHVDHSSCHMKAAEDSLHVNSLIKSDGGINAPLMMRNGWYYGPPHVTKRTGAFAKGLDPGAPPPKGWVKKPQKFWYSPGNDEDGRDKKGLGLVSILRERGVGTTEELEKMKVPELRELLASFPDFVEGKKSAVEELFLDRGHVCLAAPKMHCQYMMVIERTWAESKRYCREKCGYTLKSLRTNMKNSLEEENLPINRLRKFEIMACEHMEAHRRDYEGPAARCKYLTNRHRAPATVNVGIQDAILEDDILSPFLRVNRCKLSKHEKRAGEYGKTKKKRKDNVELKHVAKKHRGGEGSGGGA